MNKSKSIAIGIIVFIMFHVLMTPVFMYGVKSVRLSFEAEIEQCESALENYNDKESDLINLERTITDILSVKGNAIPGMLDYEECRKIIKNPEHFIWQRYGTIGLTIVLAEIFVILLIILIGLMTQKQPGSNDDYY